MYFLAFLNHLLHNQYQDRAALKEWLSILGKWTIVDCPATDPKSVLYVPKVEKSCAPNIKAVKEQAIHLYFQFAF